MSWHIRFQTKVIRPETVHGGGTAFDMATLSASFGFRSRVSAPSSISMSLAVRSAGFASAITIFCLIANLAKI